MSKLQDRTELPCGLVLPNRFVKAAMAEQMADGSNIPSERYIGVYNEWAKGEWGLMITGNIQVDPANLGAQGDLSVDSRRFREQAYLDVWRQWADACSSPTVVQINHPGRQSPRGAGNRGLFAQTVAPSAIPLDFGSGFIRNMIRGFVFGTPRELALEEINGVIAKFVAAAKFTYDRGFNGVEVHAAHGYLLAQFMSSRTNIRVDDFGGSPAKRVEIVVRIIRQIREATSPSFCIGLKLNSADVSQSGNDTKDFVEQLRRCVDAGIDFLEISGGTYENPMMFLGTSDAKVPAKTAKTAQREAFFLSFASIVRENFPSLPLVVTGGFRSQAAMDDAVSKGQCDYIGLARPAVIAPNAPMKMKEESAGMVLDAPKIPMEWWKRWIDIRALGVSTENNWYADRLSKIGAKIVS